MFYLIAFLIVLSGSFLGSAVFERRFETTLPLTSLSISLVMYVFGLAGLLEAGVIVLFATVPVLYAYGIRHLIRKRNIRAAAENFFTPAMPFFLALFVLLCVANHGKLASRWDEFSHWMDAIKAMVHIDDFVANPASNSDFPSYPPSMTVYQYFFQKLSMFCSPKNGFNEGHMFLMFQVFALSLPFTFFDRLSYRRPVYCAVMFAAVILVPIVFFDSFYKNIYIDPFVSILAGCGFAKVFLTDKKDNLSAMYVILVCFACVLSKDVGMLFACFIALAYAAKAFLMQHSVRQSARKPLFWLEAFAPALACAAAKLSWKCVTLYHCAQAKFDAGIDIFEYLSMFFLNNGDGYRQTVVNNYRAELTARTIGFGNRFFSIRTSALVLAVVFAALLVLVCLIKKKLTSDSCMTVDLAVSAAVILCCWGYVFFLGAVYAYKFSVHEALDLASCSRYLYIVFLAFFITIIMCTLSVAGKCCKRHRLIITAVVLAAMVVLTPFTAIFRFIRGDERADSYARRQKYDLIQTQIDQNCDGSDKIFVVSQEDSGLDFLIIKFEARPNVTTCGDYSFSLGPSFYEGDLWSIECGAELWMESLIEEEYDYVALYRCNDYFIETYGHLFAGDCSVADNTLYRIDREQRILVACE